MTVGRILLAAVMVVVVAVGSFFATRRPPNPNPVFPPTTVPSTTAVPSPSVVADSSHPWGISTKSTGCAYNTSQADALPDMACTPGATNPDVTQSNIQQTICLRGWSTKERAAKFPESVSGPDKIKSLQAYGQPVQPAQYEYDHKVAIEDGGNPSDAAANLWPQPIAQAKTKDMLEDFLHSEVCAGRMTLRDAQNMIAINWYAAYQQLIAAGRLSQGSPEPSTSEDSGV